MLIDKKIYNDPITDIIAQMNGNGAAINRIQCGVYEIGHWSPTFNEKPDEYPEGLSTGCYGVCDNYEQVLSKCPELDDPKRKFVVTITPVTKSNQSPDGGWRWHKWGGYIGDGELTKEYLYDEPLFEKVYCYHIYEFEA